MKMIHCADLHLDSKMSANLSKEQARKRRDELLDTFCRMVSYAAEHEIPVILIAGDLFDTNHISAKCRNVVADAIQNHPQLEFFYLRGNHDREDFLANLEEVPKNLHLFTDRWQSYRLTDGGRREVVITGAELDAGNQNTLCASLLLDMGDINIVTLHGQEIEHQTRDRAEVIALRSFRGKNIDYFALGHLHEPKLERLDARGVYCYPGCLEGRGFDECGEHGFVLLDIDTDTGRIQTQFVPFAKRTLYVVEVDISGCSTTPEVEHAIRSRLCELNYADSSLLKIVLNGQTELDSEHDLQYLAGRFEKEYFFVKITDATSVKVRYEDFALDTSLKGEFVRAVSCSDLAEDVKSRVIRIGLQALAGGEC